MSSVIEGTIAQVIDESTLVLNRGSANGVKHGMTFDIYYISDQEIRDPETGKSLGKVELYKGRGIVHSVQENLSVLKPERGGLAAFMSALSPQLHKSYPPFDSPRVGDKARSTLISESSQISG